MKKNKNISVAKLGMNRDMASDSLREQSYNFAINMNIENGSGNMMKLKSEHSNILASRFVDGYKVIGFGSDINAGATYFFLVNPSTSVSEIGVIKNNSNIDLMSDVESECPECDFKMKLNEPLEDTIQTPYLTYTTIVEDSCNNCLNFNINFPIKKVVIKNEKSGVKIFFTDNLNPPRYLDLSRLTEYGYTGNIVCNVDETIETCLDCTKLRMFPIYTPIRMSATEQILGGNLGQGQYSFYAAYANKLGEEVSEYTSLTNPVSIFDENNKILSNEERDDLTSYAIKLSIDRLDTKFSYYKIVVSYSNIVNGSTRHFEVGTYPVTTTNVLFNTTQDKKEIALSNILLPNPNIKLLEGLATSNNYLFGYGITKEKEWNLQPVVNLMGGFFKWQTQIAKEDLYEDGINISKYKSYMRDEVYPLAIQFETDFGYRTARFPLIARPATATDLELVDNLDTQSILAGANTCNSNNRNARWQFYNTASVLGTCVDEVVAGEFVIGVRYEITFIGTTDFTLIGATANTIGDTFVATGIGSGTGTANIAIPVTTVIEPVSKVCRIDNVVTLPATTFVIDDIATFTNLEDFFNNLLEEGSCTGYPFCLSLFPIPGGDCAPVFTDCDTAVLDTEFLEVNTILGEDLNITYIAFPEDYSKLKTSTQCSPDRRDSTGAFMQDLAFYNQWIGLTATFFGNELFMSYERVDSMYNTKASYAEELTILADITKELYNSYYFVFKGYENTTLPLALADASSSYISLDTGTITGIQWIESLNYTFHPNIQKDALWWVIDLTNRDSSFIAEVTKLIEDEIDRTITTFNRHVRVNILDSKTAGATSIYSNIINLDGDGLQVLVDIKNTDIVTTGSFVIGNTYVIEEVGNTDFTLIGASSNTIGIEFTATGVGGGTTGTAKEKYLVLNDSVTTPASTAIPKKLYIAIDAPLVPATGVNPDTSAPTIGYYVLPLRGCFSIGIRPLEIDFIEASFTSATFDKVQKYVADCNFEVPVVANCGVIPYKYGEFAYWESEAIYPDNNELYDSSNLVINESDFITPELAAEFQDKYATAVNAGVYTLSGDTNFVCQPIRHFKFPDNAVSPFMYEFSQAGFVKSIIYPIGVTVDEDVINDFLNIAVNNGLITEDQRNSIIGYEIFRGDRTLHKGVIAKGLAYDMYQYKEQEKDVLFSNFPYNSLGDNELFYTDDNRNAAIPHPFNSESNYNFTFQSPDTEFLKPSLPTEIKVEGYSFGKSKGVFDEVENHPKYVILGNEARRLASTLATLEVIAEAAVIAAQSAEVYRFDGGFVISANPVGIVLNIAATALNIIGAAVFKYGRYKYQWLETFRNLGSPENFAYYYTSVGEYNYLRTLQDEGNSLRSILKGTYLTSGRFTITNEVDGEKLNINNVDRENSVFITTGADFPIEYPLDYQDYDNQSSNRDISSRFFQSTTLDCAKGRSKEFIKNIASPYISLKNYLPEQYGGIDNIDWLTTSYYGDLNNPSSSCLKIFGGDTFISRHSLKRKIPMFLVNGFELADRTPFNYRAYSNIGEQPKFYANFLSPDEVTLDRGLPDISTEYKFDCLTGDRGFYVKQPSKFYLFYYGIPSFLTETTINTNFRTARPAPKDLFYPLVGDYVDWTQEKNVSIKERNEYFYSSIYSSSTRFSIGRTLPATYDKDIYDKLYDAPNGVIYSLGDNNENELTEPWLIFKPLDKYEFSSSYGKLVELRGIETAQMLARFENQSAIFNAVDVLVDGITQETAGLGTGGIFARRPVTFADTDLGYAGSQSFDMVSCEYGHFFVDAKRGQVFQVPPGGKSLNEISANINGEPSGMKNWFKEHLPFKILNKLVQDYEDIDVDNPYNAIGITMGWDSRYKRIFITKKDYKPLQALKIVNGQFKNLADEDIELTDTTYFEDVSWTVAYNLTSQSWVSYYDYKPNYYINHNNYFQTGINVTSDATELGLWSHLLSNKSFGVFYGKKYEIGLEFPTTNNYSSKTLEAMEIWTEALRYHNDYDFAYDRDINFNKLVVSNHRETSGNLRLIPQKTLRQTREYPKTYNDYQEILMTNSQDRWHINYIFNRVSSEYLNQPIWSWDTNQINKSLNNKIVKFKGKRVLERLKGNFFLNYLGYDLDTRFEVSFKWAIIDEDLN